MPRKLVLEFTKMNGAGNDFVVVDNRFYYFSDEELSELAARWCRRRTGIGADGLLALAPPSADGFHFRMRYFNADGSLGTMCGNGARCLARFAWDAGLRADELRFETDAGPHRAFVPEDPDAPVRIDMPAPRDFRAAVETDVALPGGGAPAYVWTGTEHAVCFVDRLEEVPVEEVGRRLRHAAAFAPRGVNVNFARPAEPGGNGAGALVEVRTYEKGVEAETLACGTGAVAVAVAARLTGRVSSDHVRLAVPGGLLGVRFTLEDGRVRDVSLEGPAETVYRGTLEV